MKLALRPYQEKGVGDLRDVFRRGLKAPCFVAPTGAGKTVLFVFIAHGASQRGQYVWILVHRQELVFQTSRALEALGVAHGVIAPGFTPTNDLVQVCSVQTLVRRIAQGRVGRVDLIVIDEGHHATAGSWRAILDARPDARVIGVTATPARTDGHGLGVQAGGVFDSLVLGPTPAELMEDGYLCRAVTFSPPTALDLAGLKSRGGDYVRGEVVARVDKPTITGSAVAHYQKLCPGQPAIAFCASVAHAEHVAAQFRAAGFKSDSIDGSMGDDERKGLIDALGAGKMHVLTSCEIISEGTDIPVVAAAILLRPTQSLVLHLQQVGRALRPIYAPGFDLSTRAGRLAAIAAGPKPRAIILDHVGNSVIRHGFPEDVREWSLDGVKKRASTGGGDRSVPYRQCPKCYAVTAPADTCPECGHVYVERLDAPKEVAGELEEITAEQAEQLREARKLEVRRAKTRAELEAIARARGYRAGWVDHVLRIRGKYAPRTRGAAY